MNSRNDTADRLQAEAFRKAWAHRKREIISPAGLVIWSLFVLTFCIAPVVIYLATK